MQHVTGQLELEEMVGVKRGGERGRERGQMEKGQEITFFVHFVQKCTLCTKKYTVYKKVHCVQKSTPCTKKYTHKKTYTASLVKDFSPRNFQIWCSLISPIYIKNQPLLKRLMSIIGGQTYLSLINLKVKGMALHLITCLYTCPNAKLMRELIISKKYK